jgi:ABC-type transporter Mla subunit MlaD
MALKLDILANTRQFVSEMQKAGASTEDISDALDELARQGAKDGDKLERTFKDITRASEKAEKSVKDIGKGAHQGFNKASDAGGEFKQEALANFSEVTSSFDGSMSSIGDLAQGTLGGLAASLPGIGIAAGVAAAGIGLITSALNQNEEAAKAAREKISSMYQAAAEDGRAFLTEAEVLAGAIADLFDPALYKQYKQEAEASGQTLIEIARAHNGSQQDLNDTLETARQKVANIKAEWAGLPGTISPAEVAAQDVIAKFEQTNNVMKEQKQIASQVADSQVSAQKRAQDAINKTADTARALANGTYNATISVGLDTSRANEQLRQVVRDVNNQVAYIKVGQQILR